MARLETQEIVNSAITTALAAAANGDDTTAIVRGLEAVAVALVSLELAVKEAGSLVPRNYTPVGPMGLD